MNNIFRFFIIAVFVLLLACSRKNTAQTNEKIPEIAGSWFENGDSTLPRYIVQNGADVIFMMGKQTSTGFFKSSYRIQLKDWNTSVVLSSDGSTITWADRTWVKRNFRYENISGDWYENGDVKKKITATQNGTKLSFDNGSTKADGYFYTTNAIYSTTWNKYATYSPTTKALVWSGATWLRSTK